MLVLKIVFLAVIAASQMYMIQFQSSPEGKDERGREIQYTTNNRLYTLLYSGVVLLIVLHMVEVIEAKYLADILLYFVLILSVFGSVFTYRHKTRGNV